MWIRVENHLRRFCDGPGVTDLVARNHVTLCVAQINMMLANLYRKAGQERSAVTSYKEVLRQCPLALDAIIGRRSVVSRGELRSDVR